MTSIDKLQTINGAKRNLVQAAKDADRALDKARNEGHDHSSTLALNRAHIHLADARAQFTRAINEMTA